MKQELVAQNGQLTQEGIDTLTEASIVPKGTPAAQIAVFAKICQEQGLSPFSKEIYLVGYGGKYTPIVGINGLRNLANRTGVHAGCSIPMFDMMPDGSYKTMAQYKRGELPTTCTVVIKKAVAGFLAEFASTVVFSEFKGSGKWSTMPFQMISKVAEAHAIRKAYSINGVHIEEEMDAIKDEVGAIPLVPKPVMSPAHPSWDAVLDAIKTGKRTVEDLLKKYDVDAIADLATLKKAENEAV